MAPRRIWASLACIVLALTMLLDRAHGADGEESLILSLTVNGRRVDDAALVLRRADGFYVARKALIDARLVVGPAARIVPGPGTDYVALSTLDGVTVAFDSAAQDLKLTADARVVATENVDIAQPFPVTVQTPGFGGFFNYDLVAQGGSDPAYLAGLTEAGLFVADGTLITTGLARAASRTPAFMRLDTAYVRDFPTDLMQLKVGDAITRGGDWGRPYRFGGIQIGTDFSVQPGFIPYPLPIFAGQAALPSTVDVFVNNSLRYRGTVDQGPFSLNQIPTLSGGGEARVVLTDPLGRQQSTTLPFYVSPQVLRAGISDYSYEAGFLRTGYQTRDFGYGDFTMAATHRYGLSDDLTVEGHGEATLSRATLGGSLTGSILGLGDLHGEAAGGYSSDGAGWLAGIGVSRTTQWWSFGLRHRWLSADFDRARPVLSAIGAPQRSETIGSASVSSQDYGSLSLSIARQTYQDLATAMVTSAFWSMPVQDDVILSAYATDSRQGGHVGTIGVSFTVLFDNSTTGSVEGYSRNHAAGGNAQIRRSPGYDSGWGWGAIASQGSPDRIGGDVLRRTSFGDFGAAVDHFNGGTDARLTASGGFAFADDKIFISRRVDDAFGVVSIPGFPGVTVMQENRPVGKTDQDGDVFLPKLMSHYPNKISVDPADFALDADVHDIDQFTTPSYRSATRITFDARVTVAQLLSVRRSDGALIDSGVLVTRLKDGHEFHSGFDGEVYLDGDPSDEFEVDDTPGPCRFRFPPKTAAGTKAAVACLAAR